MKKIGILMPIFSLPSKYGIGDFGYTAYEFIDILNQNNVAYWEILPINACDRLPYSPISFYALNEDYISLDMLKKDGLIKSELIEKTWTDRINYNDWKVKYYKEAFLNFQKNEDFENFKSNENIKKYVEYRVKYNNASDEFCWFLQYVLDKQWKLLKEYANNKNVKIVGDMPIYPDYKSVDVEFYPDMFELDSGKLKFVSGAAPDKYNKDGQVWGHPVYNFRNMKKDNYEYLKNRYKEFLNRYDIVRIDHFKAYEKFYKIPVNMPAKFGGYENGPKEDFFDEVMKFSKSENYWAEDMGDITKETEMLRDKYNFIGQTILIYNFDLKKMIEKEKDRKNFVIYTSNHDSETVVGWYKNLNYFQRNKVKKLMNIKKMTVQNVNKEIYEYCMKSNASVVVLTVQDIMGLDNSERINVPGTNTIYNWSWHLKNYDEFKEKIKEFKF